MTCERTTATGVLLALLFTALLGTGCATMHPEDDPDRSYFDGGALKEPDPMTIVLTGRVLRSQGRYAESEYVLRRVIDEYPRFAPAYSELGELLIKDGRTSEAINVLEVAVDELPESAFLWNDLGMCLLVAGDNGGAAERFRQAMALDPDEATYTANLAMVTGIMGSYDEAVELYGLVMPMSEARANVAKLARARGDEDPHDDERSTTGNSGS